MDTRAYLKSVTPASMMPRRRWQRMVEELRHDAEKRSILNLILTGVAALWPVLISVVLFIVYLTNGFSGGATNARDIMDLRQQMAANEQARAQENRVISDQLAKLADKIDQGPRSDQLKEVDRHLSALDGRMDGMDTRIQSDERQLTRVQTQVDTIQSSSDARLTGHVR